MEIDGRNYRIYWDVFTDVKDPITNSFVAHKVPDRNMLNVCGFGGNGIIAPGVIDMGREEISIDLAAQRYGASWFKTGARPSFAVEHPSYIDDDDQRAEFRADMNRLHSGAENWHKAAILWNGAKLKEMQASPEQAQFLETREYSAERICQMYSTPPAIVQIFKEYKFNTVDAMIMQFVLTAVRPDAIRIERAISRKVLSYRNARGRLQSAFGGEYFLEFLLEGLLRGDAKKQADTLEVKRRNGIINSNEWRAVDNLNPIGDQCDKYILPGGFGDLATLGQVAPSKPANGNGGSDNASASGQPVPMFDRGQVINAVDRAIGPRRNIVRGASLATRKASPQAERRKLIKSMALNQLTEAVDRINAVLETERERLTAKGQQLGKVQWDRHQARLESALLPGCKSYAMQSQKIDASSMATKLADCIVALQFDGQEVSLSDLAARAAKGIVGNEQS
jgi:HK97 family phage portal protein